MDEFVLDTGCLPAAHRFDQWRDLVHHALSPVAVTRADTTDFRATVRQLTAGPAQIMVMTTPDLRVLRSAALIRRSDPEQYLFSLTLDGRQDAATCGHEAVVKAGDLLLHDTSHPYEVMVEPSRVLVVSLERRALPVPQRAVDRLLGVRLPGGSGMPRLWQRFVTTLMAEPEAFGGRYGDRLGAVTLDLMGVVLSHHLDMLPTVTPEARNQALFFAVLQFIDDRLHDPKLAPPMIAAAHHVSLRQLHRVFGEHQDVPIASWIRQKRLERCRHDLKDPVLAGVPVYAIGVRWGFPHAASFSRVFRRAYGISPADYRNA